MSFLRKVRVFEPNNPTMMTRTMWSMDIYKAWLTGVIPKTIVPARAPDTDAPPGAYVSFWFPDYNGELWYLPQGEFYLVASIPSEGYTWGYMRFESCDDPTVLDSWEDKDIPELYVSADVFLADCKVYIYAFLRDELAGALQFVPEGAPDELVWAILACPSRYEDPDLFVLAWREGWLEDAIKIHLSAHNDEFDRMKKYYPTNPIGFLKWAVSLPVRPDGWCMVR